MFLNELFDSVVPFTMGVDGLTQFTANGKVYEVDFFKYENRKDCTEVSFGLRKGEYKGGAPRLMHGIEGTGDELVVFATVTAVIRQYINKFTVRRLVFTSKAAEPSRAKLYDRMVRKLAPGWTVTTRYESGEKIYWLDNPAFTHDPAPQGQGYDEDVPF